MPGHTSHIMVSMVALKTSSFTTMVAVKTSSLVDWVWNFSKSPFPRLLSFAKSGISLKKQHSQGLSLFDLTQRLGSVGKVLSPWHLLKSIAGSCLTLQLPRAVKLVLSNKMLAKMLKKIYVMRCP